MRPYRPLKRLGHGSMAEVHPRMAFQRRIRRFQHKRPTHHIGRLQSMDHHRCKGWSHRL